MDSTFLLLPVGLGFSFGAVAVLRVTLHGE